MDSPRGSSPSLKASQVKGLMVASLAVVGLLFLSGVAGVVLFLKADYERALAASGGAGLAGVKVQTKVHFRTGRVMRIKHECNEACNGVGITSGEPAQVAPCWACQGGLTLERFCQKNPETSGCPSVFGINLFESKGLIRVNDRSRIDDRTVSMNAWVRPASNRDRRVRDFGTIMSNRVARCDNFNPDDEAAREFTDQYGYALLISPSRALVLRTSDDHGCIAVESSPNVVPPGEWIHVGAILESLDENRGLRIELYVNGAPVGSLSGGFKRRTPWLGSPRNVFHVGSSSDGKQRFQGQIATAQVYGGAYLSTMLWTEPLPMDFVAPIGAQRLLVHYDFRGWKAPDEGTDKVNITDKSSGRHDAEWIRDTLVESKDILGNDLRAFHDLLAADESI